MLLFYTKRFFTIVSLIGIFFSTVQSQNGVVEFNGILTDSKTNEPIPFANIAIEGKFRGTSSNVLGEFVIKIDSLPTRLIFSHVSYTKKSVALTSNSLRNLEVKLDPKESILQEVVVTSSSSDPRVYKIMDKTIQRVKANSKDVTYGRGFYRQKSKNDSIFTELYEIFFDTRFSGMGIEGWALQEGRYAIKDKDQSGNYILNKNFTLLNRVFPTLQPRTDAYTVPMRYDWYDFYTMNIEEVLREEDTEIAVIQFSAKYTHDYSTPIMEGKLFIDLSNYDLLKIQGEIVSDDLELVTLNSKEGEWYNYKLTFESTFTQSDSLGILLDYISTRQSFDFWKDGKFDKRVETEALLSFYEYYKPKKFKRLGGRLRFNKSDVDRIDQVVYDRKFWQDNPIVKRTPVEEHVIASFEEEQQFGSIFLNNQNQVSLMPELETDPTMQQLMSMLGLHLRTQEKVYLHLDKPYYTPGEDIWFKAYLFDAQNHFLGYSPSKVLYVDLVSPEGEILYHHQLPIENGVANGDFDLKGTFPSGNYQVRAYTNWMRNFDASWFFETTIPLYENTTLSEENSTVVETDSILADIQFFPEGGDLVYTVPTQVGFKGVNKEGLGVKVDGKLVDETGKQITIFSSLHLGMGSFFFTPQAGKLYRAIVNVNGEEQTFNLPKAKESGYGVIVNNTKTNSVSVRIVATEDLEGSEVYLVGQTRGKVYYKGKGKIIKRILYFEIPRQVLPSGILQLTLFTNKMVPLNERLVFINYAQDLDINVKTNRKRYKERDKVKISVNVSDAEGKPVVAQLSMAVTDAGQISINKQRESILSNMLLTSDLKGTIENPAFYFRDAESNTQKALDALMLTQGWRRFTWQDVLNLNEVTVVYPYEQGFTLKGNATYAETGDPFEFKKMYLTALGGSSGLWSTESNAKGDFAFRNLAFSDSSDVLIQGNWAAQQVAEIKVALDTLTFPTIDYTSKPLMLYKEKEEEVLTYLKKAEERKVLDLAYPDQKTLVLDEIKVASTRQYSEDRAFKMYSEPDAVINFDEQIVGGITHVFEAIIGRVAGVTVTGSGLATQVRIRGAAQPPLILVDGIPLYTPPAMSQVGSGGSNLVGQILNSNNSGSLPQVNNSFYGTYTPSTKEGTGLEALVGISPNDVDRIEILKGSKAAAFGLRGGNGVIAIYTKRGADKNQKKPPNLFKYNGFYKTREFYSPNYDVSDKRHVKPDKRATLFWNPTFMTDTNGKASFEFFNSDEATNFQIVVEGTDGYGTFGTKVHDVNIKE